MIENVLFFTHGTLLLFFGVFLSCAFAGIQVIALKNVKYLLCICALCGIFQLSTCFLFDEPTVWKLYPLTTHLPLFLFLCIVYHKKIATSLASVFTAYLLCQPVKWFGVLTFYITKSSIAEYIVRIIVMMLTSFLILKFLTGYFAKIYNKDTRSICIFGMLPMIYYIFDYATMIYTDLWISNNRIVAEFLPMFVGISYMVFGIMYCSENEEKVIAEHKADIIRIVAEQQNKEVETIKRNEQTIKILKHDMRLFLSSLKVCLEQGEAENAIEMLSSYISQIEDVKMQHFCKIDIINYVLSDFFAKCRQNGVEFVYTVEIAKVSVDMNLFAPILSNLLDNALNAQKELEEKKRSIKLVIKTVNRKLLLSVENPIAQIPVFVDGYPVSNKKGHGYGIQSIRYMTERLNGKCKFTAENNTYIAKIII